MSTFMFAEKTCGMCGNKIECRILTSTNSFGSPDLDLRPPQMKRATMPMWVKECPNCGYVRDDIEADAKRHEAYIQTEEYKTCQNNELKTHLACKFYKCALIELQDGRKDDAYDSFLYAAWACDDVFDRRGATVCRKKAIELFEETTHKDSAQLVLRQIDLLRRVGSFEEAKMLIRKTKFKSILLIKIASFQRKLCRQRDKGCYTVSDC